jgi:peptide/nickel transport system substrate-binding protein
MASRPLTAFYRLAFTALLAIGCAAAGAQTLRLASAFDPNSLDPHALALLYQSRVITQVYEGLVNRDREFRLEPALALSWQQTDARTWRFKLRPDVRFHDGAPLTADDVVFSIERALAKTSQRAFQLRGISGVRRVDALTVDVLLSAPDAVLPEKLYLIAVMRKAWAEKHGVMQPQDYNAKQETYAVRNANGTGPFQLKSYTPDQRLVLERNPQWWGWSAAGTGNVREAVYVVIQSDATRLAALASGQVDFVIDPPFQDVARLKRDKGVKVIETSDIGTQYLGFDQQRAELQYGQAKGNPFKDVRVRRAVMQAIDVDLIIQKVLRGQAQPAGSHLSRLVDGARPDLEGRRLPYDPAAARALLTQAGYGNGFEVTLDCVNITFRAAVCQAIAAMLAQVNIKVTFQPFPSATFFPKLTQANSSFFEFGWTPAVDAWATLNSIVRTYDGAGAGQFNGGRYSNPKLDALIDGLRVEPDLARRRRMVGEALAILQEDLPLIPLYRRTLAWAMTPNIDVVQWPSDSLELRWVRIR